MSDASAQKRNAVRVAVARLPAQLWLCGLAVCRQQAALLLNISGSGALLEAAQALPAHLRVHCRFALTPPHPALTHSVAAVVIRSMPARQSDQVQLALQFHFMQEGKRDTLIAWVFEELLRQKQRR